MLLKVPTQDVGGWFYAGPVDRVKSGYVLKYDDGADHPEGWGSVELVCIQETGYPNSWENRECSPPADRWTVPGTVKPTGWIEDGFKWISFHEGDDDDTGIAFFRKDQDAYLMTDSGQTIERI